VDVLQTWLIFGVPGLVLAAGMFAGRSQLRSLVGYAVLVALVVVFLVVPGDIISAASVGLIAFFLVALGRGMQPDAQPEEQAARARYTHAAAGEG
jgi:uncharacterized membrane protein YoaK (UPF0700 family)